jgi:hypothetical protein
MNTLKRFKAITLFAVTVLLIVIAASISRFMVLSSPITQRQEFIHERGSIVMPFDLSQTTHFFSTTDSGGFMQVRVKDPNNKEQVALIRSHLKSESENFSAASI